MKKLITYILPLILAISLSGCYTQFQTLNNAQYYGSDNNYGYAPSNDESAYTEGYRTGWNDYSLYSFRDYNYTRYWADFYGGYYNSPYYWSPYYSPYIHPYGYMGFGYTWDPYFAFNFGYYNYGYSPYGYGYNPYGYYGGYYHHYYSYNYYEVPNSGNNIYRNNHPRSMGVQPANRNTGSYGYNRPQRGSTYTPRSSGNSGNTTQGTYNSRPRRQPRSTGNVRSSGSSRPERAPRSSGRSAPAPSNNGGSRPDRGGNHQMLFSPGTGTSTQSATPRDNGRNYYRPQRGNRNVQHNTTNNRNNNNLSFHSLIRPDRSASQSSSNNSSVTRTQNSRNVNIGRRSAENYQRSERSSRNRNVYYYRPSHNNNRNFNVGYSRSSQSNNRSTYSAPHQTFQHFSSPHVNRAPRVDRSSNNSHSSSSGNRPRRH